MGIGLVLASTIPTLIVAGEKPFVRPEGMKVNIFSVFVKIYLGFRHMPFNMMRVCLVFFFSWYTTQHTKSSRPIPRHSITLSAIANPRRSGADTRRS